MDNLIKRLSNLLSVKSLMWSMVVSTRKTEKLILDDKSRSKKFAVSAKTPLKKLLFSAIPGWNRIREPAKSSFL